MRRFDIRKNMNLALPYLPLFILALHCMSHIYRPLPILLFFVCFLLLFWAEHCFKEAFLLLTSAYFGRNCSHFCSLKCANYSYFCFARSISARCVVSARYVLQIPPFLLYVQRLWPWFSQRSQLHGSCAGCLGAIVHGFKEKSERI